jgi:hypothetical protein
MQQAYRMLAAAIGWFALLLQYYLIVRYKTDGDLATAAIRFLSYFTILSNILVALAMTLPWAAPDTRAGRFFQEPSVRTAILVYIIIVAVIYHYLLAPLWNPQGSQLVADTIEHVVVPALYIVDWVLFVPKGTLQFKSAFAWLGFPFAYAGYSLAHGAATGFYPYPFLDVATLKLERVLVNMGVLVAVFAGLGLLLIALDRGLARFKHKGAATGS